MFDSLIPEDYFWFHRNLMLYVGVWTFNKRHKLYRVHHVFTVIQITIMALFIISELLFLAISNERNADNTVYTIGVVSLHLLALGAGFYNRITRRTLQDAIELVCRDTFTFKGLPSSSADQRIKLEREVDEIVNKNNYLARKWSFIVMFAYIGGVFVDLTLSYVGMYCFSMLYARKHYTDKEVIYQLPYFVWMPFDIRNDVNFTITFLFDVYAMNHVVALFLICDSCMFAIIFHLIYQVRTIKEYLAAMDDSFEGERLTPYEERIHKMKLIKCLIELKTIIEIIGVIERLFNYQILGKFICGTLILISYVQIFLYGESLFLKISTYYSLLAIICEPLINCWLCQSMTEELESVSRAIYFLDWTRLSPSYNRDLVFVMMRFQRPVGITVGKFSPNDLQMFILFIKGTYSLYTLITQTNKE